MILDGRHARDIDFAQTLAAPTRVDRAQALLRRVRGVVGASPWASLAGRGCVLMLGLVVLAWIGRAATAATPRSASTPSSMASDAGIASVAVLAQLPPSPPSPPATPPAPLSPPVPPPPSTGHARATPEDPVYINHASMEELRRLPGVGPKRAEAIVALRQRMGRFQRVEDLLRVKGIGRATIRKWRPLLRLDAPAAADAGPPAVTAEQGARAP